MRTVLMGIGNILMQDEGIGVHTIRAIEKRYSFNPAIEIIDAGTLGLEMLYMLQDGVDNLIVVDAVMGGKPPGTTYIFRNNDVKKYYFKNKLSAHEVGFSEVLALLETIGKPIKENLILVGVEPFSFEVSLEPHEMMTPKIEDLIKIVLEELRSIGVKAFEKTLS